MRRRIGFWIAVVVAASMFIIGFSYSASAHYIDENGGTGCPDGHGCAWHAPNYSGTNKDVWDSGNANETWFAGSCCPWYSAKNRFNVGDGRRMLIGRGDVSSWNRTGCLNPGDNRPDPGWFNVVKIGADASRC